MAAASAPYKLSNGIEVPLVDDREHLYLELDNGLKVLVISDPNVETSAAAVEISVGHWSDPIAGLAHFLEHMLFLGTEAYPDENSFGAFLNEHGGQSNAYTAEEATNCARAVNCAARARAHHPFTRRNPARTLPQTTSW